MASKKTALDKLDVAIASILTDYEDEVSRKSTECVKRVTAAGAAAVRRQAEAIFPVKKGKKISGDYAKGWAWRYDEKRLETVGIIYNKDKPGLAHLLEHGHVTRNGTGRTYDPTPAHVHIQPVEERIAEDFGKDLIEVLQR